MEDRQRPKRNALMQEKERQRRSGRRPSLQASAAVAAASVEPSENANEQRERLRNVFQVCIDNGYYLSNNPAWPMIFQMMDEWKDDTGKITSNTSQRSLSAANFGPGGNSRISNRSLSITGGQFGSPADSTGLNNDDGGSSKKSKTNKFKDKRRASILDELLREKEMLRKKKDNDGQDVEDGDNSDSISDSADPRTVMVRRHSSQLYNLQNNRLDSTSSTTNQSNIVRRRPHVGVKNSLRRTSKFDNLGLKRNMSIFMDDVRKLSNQAKQYTAQINLSFPRHEIRLINVSYTVLKTGIKDEMTDDPNPINDDRNFLYNSSNPADIYNYKGNYDDVEPGNLFSRRSLNNPNNPHASFPERVFDNGIDAFHKVRYRLLHPTKPNVEFTKTHHTILRNINLRFESGKMYLVLGGACSGKSTLLKAIAGILQEDRNHLLEGEISINSGTRHSVGLHTWSNLVTFADNRDVHLPRLTVQETVEFAWKCKSGGTHRGSGTANTPEINEVVTKLDSEKWRVSSILQGMGLSEVQDSLVGDETLRGVSGGERRRVTIAELLSISTPIVCIDEMSTGLDAATTFDIVRLLSETVRDNNAIYIVSLLQPPPETFALFDECIVLDRGSVIYSGIVRDTLHHFHEIGYQLPPRMDLAEWLQCICQPDGGKYQTRKKTLNPQLSDMLSCIEQWDISSDEDSNDGAPPTRLGSTASATTTKMAMNHLTNAEFVDAFMYSHRGQNIMDKILSPLEPEVSSIAPLPEFLKRYQNPPWKSLLFVLEREFLMMWRARHVLLRDRCIQNLTMALLVGVFFYDIGSTSDSYDHINSGSVIGVFFHSVRYIALNAAREVIPHLDVGPVVQKQYNSNFFPMYTYIIGRSVSLAPLLLLDTILYGVPVYIMCSLGSGSPNRFENLMYYLTLLWFSGYTVYVFLGIFSASIRNDKSIIIAVMAVQFFIFVLTSGYTIQYPTIHENLQFLYWANYMAWVLRGMVVNEFRSGAEKYEKLVPSTNLTVYTSTMTRFGYIYEDEPFSREWINYAFLFCFGLIIISIALASLIYNRKVRVSENLSALSENSEFLYLMDDDWYDSNTPLAAQLQPAILTFKDINYSVRANGKVILNNVTGYIMHGKMTALMGSSGSGKTSLMECLSLRRRSGIVTGEIRLNGHVLNPHQFRRSTGYVEQFDFQSATLTVRETVKFSALLRLDDASRRLQLEKIIDQTLEMLELTLLEHHLVGSSLSSTSAGSSDYNTKSDIIKPSSSYRGGRSNYYNAHQLTTEQRKRLSIAVELVANPSILFLDEPTSGLDSRGANIVIRCLKRIAKSGRAVCATIHQPSISIFNSFDSLILMKKGGKVAFFGDIGHESDFLIKYLEHYPETPKILEGENPATWMLTTVGKRDTDYEQKFLQSDQYRSCLQFIDRVNSHATEQNMIQYNTTYAASIWTQNVAVVQRMMKIYSRSPSYNFSRIVQAATIALLMGLMFDSRTPKTEGDMTSRVNSIYIAVVFIMTTSFDNVLPLFEVERNLFYKHQANAAYAPITLINALLLAEVPYIMFTTVVFCTCFYFSLGFDPVFSKMIWFNIFFGMNMAMWTFLGQAFISLFQKLTTAQGYGGLLVSLSNLLAGVIIYPQDIPEKLMFFYWLIPSHYVVEGILMSQYDGDKTPILSTAGSPFYDYISAVCGNQCCSISETGAHICTGTASDWVLVTFDGHFSIGHLWINFVYLIIVCSVSRVVTFLALVHLNHSRK